jgi:hypothetical protein
MNSSPPLQNLPSLASGAALWQFCLYVKGKGQWRRYKNILYYAAPLEIVGELWRSCGRPPHSQGTSTSRPRALFLKKPGSPRGIQPRRCLPEAPLPSSLTPCGHLSCGHSKQNIDLPHFKLTIFAILGLVAIKEVL